MRCEPAIKPIAPQRRARSDRGLLDARQGECERLSTKCLNGVPPPERSPWKPPMSQALDELPLQQAARVTRLQLDGQPPEWARQLADIGFTPGESVQVLRRAPFGGDPLVVRVGDSRFALRRAEARCVRVQAA